MYLIVSFIVTERSVRASDCSRGVVGKLIGPVINVLRISLSQ